MRPSGMHGSARGAEQNRKSKLEIKFLDTGCLTWQTFILY